MPVVTKPLASPSAKSSPRKAANNLGRAGRGVGGYTQLREVDPAELPKPPRLPKRKDGVPWSSQAKAVWHDAWRDPITVLWSDSDRHTLLTLADLQHRFDLAEGHAAAARLSSEMRALRKSLLLGDPAARLAARIEVVRADEAEERAAKRRRPKIVEPVATEVDTDKLSEMFG